MSTPKEIKRKWSLDVPASQVINLIQHYLTESGLKKTSTSLLKETNIGSRGLLKHAHTHIMKCCKEGDWGTVLETLSIVTLNDGSENNTNENSAQQHELDKVIAGVHEMAILELADAAEMDLAFATFKMCRDVLDKANDNEEENGSTNNSMISDSVLSESVERKLHAINALRSVRAAAASFASNQSSANALIVPRDYYGPNKISKEERRYDIGKRLGKVIPIIPSSRLLSLCQQAIKWQIHTGDMPMIRDFWHEDVPDRDDDGKKRKKPKQTKQFDLVLGEVNVESVSRDVLNARASTKTSSLSSYERIPLDPYSTIKFGKKTVATTCMFYTDTNINQTSLITGTSDGFIEVWDSESKFRKLRLDLDYQKKEELMCHDPSDDNDAPLPSILAMAINSEGTMLATGDSYGTVLVWNLQTGQTLVELDKAHAGAITCLDFSQDGSKILSGSQDGACREFGLRTKRMLKEFRGHSSFVNCCRYIAPGRNSKQTLLVATASADSTVRIWCGRSAELKYMLNPLNATGSNAIVSLSPTNSSNDGDLGRNIHTILPLHTPSNTIVIIPRGPKAFLVTLNGLILKTFENEGIISADNDPESKVKGYKGDFVCGTISPTNKWLYLISDGGSCVIYDIGTGAVEHKIADFGFETTDGKQGMEITLIVHHPREGILAAFSSSTAQKKGVITLWK